MNTTVNINLCGMAFTINEDAYKKLSIYIKSYEDKYDDKEIAKDIEARLAELFTEYLSKLGRQIIEIEDVERAIEQIGEPNQEEQSEGQEATKQAAQPKKLKKKFYRDTLCGVIGGVSSGIAAYAGIETSIVRLLWVLLFLICNPLAIIAYIVMWIVLPDAKTPQQRLEMQSKELTTENIQKETEKIITKRGNHGCLSVLGKVFIVGSAIFILIIIITSLTIFAFFGKDMLEDRVENFGNKVENTIDGYDDDDYDGYYAAPDSFTVTLKTVYCGGDYAPALSGTANRWSAQPMQKLSDSIWVLKIPADKYNEIKFQDTKGGWSNEIEFYDAETQSWQKLSNIHIGPEPAQTFDFRNPQLYRWSRCGK